MSYGLFDYGQMIGGRVRTGAFLRALERVVTSDSVVVDIGAGTGIFALSACRMGARHVYAIEPDDVIEVARQIATDSGLADRITFLHATSLAVDLPEPADVIISDIGGLLPHYNQHIASIIDARERWLGDTGVLIPSADTLRCAVVETPELYQQTAGVWEDQRFGLDMRAARALAVNHWRNGRVHEAQLLSDVASLTNIDYATISSRNLDADASLAVRRPGTAYGLLVWFDRDVASDIRLSNAPGATADVAPQHIYGTAFFPWSRPVDVRARDEVTVRLRANSVGGDYVWRWSTRVTPPAAAGRDGATFSQSTFHATPLSKQKVRARAAGFRPTLNADGRVTHYVLSMMTAELSLWEIAERVRMEFPDRFASASSALDCVSELSLKFGLEDAP